jgi:hypothetical protein
VQRKPLDRDASKTIPPLEMPLQFPIPLFPP